MCLAWSMRVFATNIWSVPLRPLVKAPWKGWDMLALAMNCIRRVFRMPVKSLPKQLVMEIGR